MTRERAAPVCDGLGLAATALLTGLVIWQHPDLRAPAAAPPQAQSVQLSVIAAPPAPPTRPTPPKPVQPKLLPPDLTPPEVIPPLPPPLPQAMEPLPLPTPLPHPIHRLRSATMPPVETPPPASAPRSASAAFDIPPRNAPTRDANTEDLYVGGLHAYLLGRTAPPDSAAYRLLRPYGTVDVAFILARDGTLRGAHVLHSSGSELLDHQALEIVEGGHYPAIPARAFAGEAEHNFHIPIEFRPSGSDE